MYNKKKKRITASDFSLAEINVIHSFKISGLVA